MSDGCTGSSARWCPMHGDCTCPPRYEGAADGERTLDHDGCPLHGSLSGHALSEVDDLVALQIPAPAQRPAASDPEGKAKAPAKRRRRPEMAFLRRLEVELCKIPGVCLLRTFTGKVRVEHDDGSTSWVEGMPTGTADLIGVGTGGCALAIEVKARKGRPTKAQEAFLRAWLKRDAVVMIARQEFKDLDKSVAHAKAMLQRLLDDWNLRRANAAMAK